MLPEFFYRWNPFNLYGVEVQIEDLICDPLGSNETLMQDGCGFYRRIKAPSFRSTLLEKILFWLQTHLNEKGHLEAIDQLISLFHEQLLVDPPRFPKKLEEFKRKLDKLRSLKNDYAFVHLKKGDPSIIELRLWEMEQYAYSILIHHMNQEAFEQEKIRKKTFNVFRAQIEGKLDELTFLHLIGLQKARFVMVASSNVLRLLFEEHVLNLATRLSTISELQGKVDVIEKEHEGKFTIPSIHDYFRRWRKRLNLEIRRLKVEANILIGNLIINYKITPVNEEAKLILLSLNITPEDTFLNSLDEEVGLVHLFGLQLNTE